MDAWKLDTTEEEQMRDDRGTDIQMSPTGTAVGLGRFLFAEIEFAVLLLGILV